MIIGTMRARSLLQKDFRQARRGSGQGDMVWQQMSNKRRLGSFNYKYVGLSVDKAICRTIKIY